MHQKKTGFTTINLGNKMKSNKTYESTKITDCNNISDSELCAAMKIALDNPAELKINMLRNWSKEKRDLFAKHLLGDKA